MQDMIKQEQFEIEVLDRLNSSRLLGDIVFGGGTMLRLCHGLNRFSVDLDFWITGDVDVRKLFKGIEECLIKFYVITDSAEKFHTLLFEIRSADYPRKLKIEIRKEKKSIKTEETIAYSKHSTTQVILKTVSLDDMMLAKVDAFLDRKEIRDIFDIEFLVKKGAGLNIPASTLKRVLTGIDGLKKDDYAVKLGSLLEGDQRKYYTKQNFKIVRSAISAILTA